jgi:signal recognition particle subunit SEC65
MTEIFVLEPVAADERGRRVPDDLPINTPERDTLGRVLRESGYAIVSIDADTASPTEPDADKSRLRAAVEALVNEAEDSEAQRLEAAATAKRLTISTSVSGAPALIR